MGTVRHHANDNGQVVDHQERRQYQMVRPPPQRRVLQAPGGEDDAEHREEDHVDGDAEEVVHVGADRHLGEDHADPEVEVDDAVASGGKSIHIMNLVCENSEPTLVPLACFKENWCR